MTVVFGHPSGTPFAHHAALAHFEAGVLESFCVPWMPSATTLRSLETIFPFRSMVRRLRRRAFEPLATAPKTQGRTGEMRRLLLRAIGHDADPFTHEANQWLMRVMTRECENPRVTAVHAYEDCSLSQFRQAKQLGKFCIYDMPIGYYAVWDRIQSELRRKYRDWIRPDSLPAVTSRDQKRWEMEMADIVLAPSRFVADSIQEFHPGKTIAIAPYGIDLESLPAPAERRSGDILTFLFVGHCSVRKGVPLLLEAWRAANLKDARLQLVGNWQLAEEKKRELPPGCSWHGPVSSGKLRDFYREADVFVFPSNFEGRALVIGEVLASGVPVLTTAASGAGDIVDESCGRIVPADNLEAQIAGLRWFAGRGGRLADLKVAARAKAEQWTWKNYRMKVSEAVRPYL